MISSQLNLKGGNFIMNPILILGGALNMNPRYYIKGGKVCYRYNNLFRQKQRALRKDELEASVKLRQNLIITLILAIAIITICEVAYILISPIHHYSVTYDRIKTTVTPIIEESNNIPTYDEIKTEVRVSPTLDVDTGIDALERTVDDESIEILEAAHKEITESLYKNPYTGSDLLYRETTQYQTIDLGDYEFTELALPSEYYGKSINFSSFYPFEYYTDITNKKSKAYKITRSDNSYTDENGLRRYALSEGEFSIDGKDDYLVAMGTFYKPHGTIGNRYVIETTTGSYTVRTADEKSDSHTDTMNMFTTHGGGKYAAILEFIVDGKTLDPSIKASGTITKGEEIESAIREGKIIHIYEISDT